VHARVRSRCRWWWAPRPGTCHRRCPRPCPFPAGVRPLPLCTHLTYPPTHTPTHPVLLCPPAGVYNQVSLKALDQVLAEASDRALRLVLILARNWGGPDSRAAVSAAVGELQRVCQVPTTPPSPHMPACARASQPATSMHALPTSHALRP